MFNTNLQASHKIEKPYYKTPAKTRAPKSTFAGTAFEPIRPEHYTIKVDNTVINKKNIDSPQKKSFFEKIHDRFVAFLVNHSDEIMELEEQKNLPFEYRISYYA